MDKAKTQLISGYEMLPLIGSNCILKVTVFVPENAKVGDIVCLSSAFKQGSARRIFEIEQLPEGPCFHVKEDASDDVLQMGAEQITYTVLGIAGRSFSFAVNSAVGKAASHIALSDSVPAKMTRKGLGLAARIAKRLSSESPF